MAEILSREQVERLRDQPHFRTGAIVQALCEGWLAQQDALEAAEADKAEIEHAFNVMPSGDKRKLQRRALAAEARVAAQQRVIDAIKTLPVREEVDVNGEYTTTRALTASEFRAALLSINEAPLAVVGKWHHADGSECFHSPEERKRRGCAAGVEQK
jgi:hypothetical protein